MRFHRSLSSDWLSWGIQECEGRGFRGKGWQIPRFYFVYDPRRFVSNRISIDRHSMSTGGWQLFWGGQNRIKIWDHNFGQDKIAWYFLFRESPGFWLRQNLTFCILILFWLAQNSSHPAVEANYELGQWKKKPPRKEDERKEDPFQEDT